MTPHDVRLDRLLIAQRGVVSRQQLVEIGLDRSAIWRLTTQARLQREGRAFIAPGVANDLLYRAWRAALATDAVISHQSALALHDVGRRSDSGSVHVTVQHSTSPSAPDGVVLHRTRRLPASHVVRTAGRPSTTNLPRTLVDVSAAPAGVADALIGRWIHELVVSGQMSMAWLAWFLRNEAVRLNGRSRLQALLADMTGTTDTVAERELTAILKAEGIGGWTTQYEIRDGARFLGRVDWAWPDNKVGLELDDFTSHTSPERFHHDRSRGNAIEIAGWLLLRTTPWLVFNDRRGLVDTIWHALAARPALPPTT